ncbi:MAG TPA: hypothetical protein VEO01_22800 [Pseudonocardiaceae bacterium]|nr:hypothetical protein [Pseudonocardiaceae bacterium]
MDEPRLIAAYLAELTGQLPATVVAELADGLRETFESHRGRGLSLEDAADAAVAEFGDATTIVAAFAAANPARDSARSLLLTGPVVGGACAAVLLAEHAWDWPVAIAARIGFGAAVITGVVLLAVAASGAHYRQAGRSAAAGCVVVLAIDLAMLSYVTSAGILTTWPVPAAAALSAARISFTLSRLPRTLARH